MRANAGIRRALALLMSLTMLLTLAPVSVFAAEQTITLSFGEVKWTDSDEDLQDYDDLAGQKVLVAPIVATTSDGQPFNMGGCEFQVDFNRDNKALVYQNIEEEGCGVLGFVGKGKNFLNVTASDPSTANADGYVKALFSDMNGRSFAVENNQVIAKIIFWPDESGTTLAPDLTFHEGARVSDVDADKNPVPYTVTASGSVNVPAFDPNPVGQTITLSFGDVKWTDSDEDLQDYEDLAGQKVLVAPIVATSSDEQPFNVGGCEFQVNFNRNNKTLVYKAIADEASGVLGFIGKGKNFLSVTASDVNTANSDGYVKALFSDMNGRSFEVENNQVIAKIVFWPDDAGKDLETQLSFNEGARVSDVDADKNPVPYTVTASGSVTVEPYNGEGVEKVTVTYKANGGSGDDIQETVDKGATVTLKPVDTFTPPANQEFKAWDVDGEEKQPNDSITVNANTEIKAIWKDVAAETVTVTYKANGGSGNDVQDTVDKGTSVTLRPSNTFTPPANQEFKAWDVDGEEKQPGASITVNANTEIKAVWKDVAPESAVTVTYKADGGSGDDIQETVDKGATVTLKPADTFAAPTGKTFKAWDVDGEEKQPGASITVNANTEIKAVWKDVDGEMVTVTFDSNDGTSAPQKVTVNKGEKVSKPEQDPVRDGFTFTGWFEDENNSGEATKKVDFPYTADKDITFYAGWEENQPPATEKVTVTFNGNGGTPKETKEEINKGEKVSKPNDPTWENHTFTGWFEDEDATKKVTFPVTVDENTTFYAGWEATYAVEIDEDIEHGKVTAKPTSAAEGDKITLTITPDKGYELDECTVTDEDDDEIEVEDDFTFEMPASNVTVSATFTLSDITVNYTATPSKGGSVTGPKTLKPGDTVTFEVTANDGYVFQTLTFNGKTLTMEGDKATFKVPEDATKAEVKATFKASSGGSGSSGGSSDSGGCYIATSVYGSYDTPEVWTLRRFRDDVLGQTWYGRLFIKAYYATSPTLVRWFGNVEWFQNFWRDTLDSLVSDLQEQGFESTPYEDKDW